VAYLRGVYLRLEKLGSRMAAPDWTLAYVTPPRPKLPDIGSTQAWMRTTIGTHVLSHIPSPVLASLLPDWTPVACLPTITTTSIECILTPARRDTG
jgi:hypothetical protein